MRIWSLHPRYLDRAGLVALWREALLAKKVLLGKTQGYKHHPQLIRFRFLENPVSAMDAYLFAVFNEALSRGYSFDRTKVGCERETPLLSVTLGQLAYEWQHLKGKLMKRDPERYRLYTEIATPDPHPLFRIVPGEREGWEKIIE